MDQMTFVSLVLVSFPEAVLVAALGLVLAGIRPRWHQLVLVGVLQAGVAYLIRLLQTPFGLHTLVLAVVFIIIIRMVIGLGWRLAALAGLLGLTIYIAIETFNAPLLLYLTGYSLTYVMQDVSLRFLFFLPQALLMGVLTWVCVRFNFRLLGSPPKYGGDSDEWRVLNRSYLVVYLLAILPIMLLGILNMAFFYSQIGVFTDQHLPVFLAIVALAVFVLTASLPLKIQAVGRAVDVASKARENAESLVHIGELLQLMRYHHHDFYHQLQTIYGLLETGYYDEARQHIREAHETISAPLELIRTDQPHVTALLYTKLALAEAKQIHLEPVIECSLQELPLSPWETSALLGNILDNALEAVENSSPEDRMVRLEIRRDPGGYAFTVANRGRPNSSRETLFFLEGYSTKEGHSGMGLASARKIVAKYGGGIEVLSDDRDTVFSVWLPLGDAPPSA